MAAASGLLRAAGQVSKRPTSGARLRAAQFTMLIALVLGTAGFVAPAGAWALGALTPTPSPSPDHMDQVARHRGTPAPTPQDPPTSATPKVSRAADVGIMDVGVSRPLQAATGLSAEARDKTQSHAATIRHAQRHRLTASGERARFARSLVYSAMAALVIAGGGLLFLGARRRLW